MSVRRSEALLRVWLSAERFIERQSTGVVYEKKEKINKEVEVDIPLCNFKRKPSKKTLLEYEQEVGEEV